MSSSEETTAAGQQTPGGGDGLPDAAVPQGLLGFYQVKRVKLALWVKTVGSAGSFPPAETDAVLAELGSLDPNLAKTRLLAELNRPPAAVERWVAQAWRHIMRARVERTEGETTLSGIEQLAAIRGYVSAGLRASNKSERTFAENFLRLSLLQLLDKRELDPAEVLRTLNDLFRKGSDVEERALRRGVRARLPKAKLAQLKDLTLAYALAHAEGATARKDLGDARSQIAAFGAQLEAARDRAASLETQLAEAQGKVGELEHELELALQTARDNRQLGAHGQSEIRGRLRVFLAEHMELLLSDAADAADEPEPFLDVVRDRLKSARKAMRGEITWLDTQLD